MKHTPRTFGSVHYVRFVNIMPLTSGFNTTRLHCIVDMGLFLWLKLRSPRAFKLRFTTCLEDLHALTIMRSTQIIRHWLQPSSIHDHHPPLCPQKSVSCNFPLTCLHFLSLEFGSDFSFWGKNVIPSFFFFVISLFPLEFF